jgi:precorrin-2 dehydrogenase/sirohydrochlorin ferrochelatase
MELFPLFLKLEGRPCLVVGAGRVAESKVWSLLRCGARVRVVAPEATEALRHAAQMGQIAWERRTFLREDLAGTFLVVAATSSPALHESIFRSAQAQGILCNAVDEPERCDFFYPAVVRRGPLQIAISTSGQAPVLAQRIREDLERHFAPEYGPWVEAVGQARTELLATELATEERIGALRALSSDQAFEEFRAKAAMAGKEPA